MEQAFGNRLEEALRELPPDKIREVADFVAYLRQKYVGDAPRRGSPEAVLRTLDEVGSLDFEPGELDRRLSEIQSMREMEIETDD